MHKVVVKGEEDVYGLMVPIMMVNGSTTRDMAPENLEEQMDTITRVAGHMTLNQEPVKKLMKMETHLLLLG